jgi:hypothetical protein
MGYGRACLVVASKSMFDMALKIKRRFGQLAALGGRNGVRCEI